MGADGAASPAEASLYRKASDLESSAGASGSGRKNAGLKDSTLHSVNKATAQIRKPPHRRNASPINWFPRKKMDSFLKRKIRHFQEVGGMNLTLDETLENANLHYTRIAREKIAAQEAARKAMEARKAAMIEASWCRILRAARIQSKLAEQELEKAEKCASDVFEAARSMGVMMYDRPDCPRGPCEVETSSAAGGRSTHTVTASFETAFEVDKEVAAAVKKAFIRLANCPSSLNKEEFNDILHKISQNPDTSDMHEDQSVIFPEGRTETALELEKELVPSDYATNKETDKKQKNHRNSLLLNNYDSASFSPTSLIDKMLGRLKDLTEDELSSLAIIVATCGLNAALLEADHSKDHDGYLLKNKKETLTEIPSLDKFLVKHVSKLEREVQDARNTKRSNQAVPDGKMSENEVSGSQVSCNKLTSSDSSEIPSLDKVLVKHVSKLEREVQDARNTKRSNQALPEGKMSENEVSGSQVSCNKLTSSDSSEIPGLDKVLVKHVSRLEKEVQEARNLKKTSQAAGSERGSSSTVVPSLDKCLVKHSSRLQREVQRARNNRNTLANENNENPTLPADAVKLSGLNEIPSLDKCLVKHVSRLEKARNSQKGSLADVNMKISEIPCTEVSETHSINTNTTIPGISEIPSLDQFLVKHVSRLEREVQEARNAKDYHVEDSKATLGKSESKVSEVKSSSISTTSSVPTVVPSLDKFLVKHVSRLEREVQEARKNKIRNPAEDNQTKSQRTTVEVSRSQLLGTDTKISSVHSLDENTGQENKENLDMNTALESKHEIQQVAKHMSRIERAKMESLKSFCSQDCQESDQNVEAIGLDKILVKPLHRMEKEKVHRIKQEKDQHHVDAHREAREREVQEAWGGLSLGNCIRPHLSKLEREKAAWRKAEEEQQRRGREL